MDIKINLDDQDKAQIAQEVVKAILPHLKTEGGAKDDSIFTVETLAEYLHTSKKWVYERVQFKEIPFTKTGGFLRFKKSEIDKWLDSHKTPAVNPLTVGLGKRFR